MIFFILGAGERRYETGGWIEGGEKRGALSAHTSNRSWQLGHRYALSHGRQGTECMFQQRMEALRSIWLECDGAVSVRAGNKRSGSHRIRTL